MASAFTHAVVGVALGKGAGGRLEGRRRLLLGASLAAAPDLDAIGHRLGVPYQSVWRHRGITHSLFAAAVVAGSLTWALYRAETARGACIIANELLWVWLPCAALAAAARRLRSR